MLKNLRFSGIFRDENLSVHVMLENPADYGLEYTSLVFSVTVKGRNGGTPKMTDSIFYVMDEANSLYSAVSTPMPALSAETDSSGNEPIHCPDWLIFTDFKHHFLFQDLRIVFYYQPYKRFNIIELNH